MQFPEFNHPMWPLLSQVSRPSRYTCNEWRPHPPLPWDNDKNIFKLCLLFPDVYEIGMSYYGFQLLSAFVTSLGHLVDRAYCPWVDMEALLKEHRTPLISVEHQRPLSEFDAVGFTLQHEMSYTNVLTMLELGGIPLRSEERGEDDPIVLAGGPGALVPEPMAPFIDAFCVGEGEVILPALLAYLDNSRGAKREERLKGCASLPGVYVPSLAELNTMENCVYVSKTSDGAFQVKRQIMTSFEDAFLPDSLIVPSVGIVHDRASLELFRGCSRGCRFCQAGMVTRPVRERNPDKVTASILNMVKDTGWEEAGLLSLASCDYSGIGHVIEALLEPLAKKRVKLSLPSLRMDGFSVELAEKFQKMRRGSLTFAPEAGTQRMRDVINKGFSEDEIFSCFEQVFSLGWDKIKLYFMMGLPTETQEDLNGIVHLSQSALKIARRHKHKRASVSVSVAGFVPKAHTPFQWERQDTIEELRNKGRYIKGQIRDRAISLKYHEPEQSFLEGVLARGDRRTADVIERAWRTGARFDSWSETFDLNRWLSAFEYCGLNPEDFTRARDDSEKLPWDHIDAGITKEFLLRERRQAYSSKVTADCSSGCAACGIGCFNPSGGAP